jgi:pimeloyl-ACP methyl ester carboxylesterase
MKWRGRVVFWILFPVLLYLLLVTLLWVVQDRLIFPGATWGRGEPLPFAPGVTVERLPLPGKDATFRIAVAEPSRAQAVALCFGGNGEDLRHGIQRALMFAEYGIRCVGVEYPGYGESGGQVGERDFHAAAEAAAGFARDRAQADGLPLFAIGVSMGSFSATHLAATGRVERALIVSAPTSIEAGARLHYFWVPVSLLLRHRLDNLARADRVACPVLVIHGDRDRIVPLEMGRMLAGAFANGQFVVAEGYGHNDLPLDRRGPFGERIADFFEVR